MNRPALSELTESVGEAVSTGTSILGELAGSAVELVAEVPERVAVLTRHSPPPRRKFPWLILILVAAATAAAVWWFRRDRSPFGDEVNPVAPVEDGAPPIAGS